jgi:hypothetical protein
MTRCFSLPAVVLAAALLVSGSAMTIHAQTDYSSRKASSRLGVGAGASIGVALPISGELPDSVEAAPGFAFRGGLNLTYPVTSSFGVLFNFGLDTRGVGKKFKSESDNRVWRLNYLFLEPGISISAFRLSVNIGLPSGGSEPLGAVGAATSSRDIESDELEMMIEPRIGGTLILVDTKEWWLGLNVDAGMTINRVFKDEIADVMKTDVHAMKMLSAHLGLTWQFGVPGTGGL